MWSCWRANAPCLHMLALFILLPEPQMALYFWLMGLLPSYGSAHTALSLRDQLDGDLGLTRFSSTWAPRKDWVFQLRCVFFVVVNLCCEILFSELNFHLILICLLQFECRRGPSVFVFTATVLVVSLMAGKRQWWMGQRLSDWAEAVHMPLAWPFCLLFSWSCLSAG